MGSMGLFYLVRSFVDSVQKRSELKKYESYIKDKQLEYKEPPTEVRKPAVDELGFTVEQYLVNYWNGPPVCDTMKEFYDCCLEVYDGNVSKCSSFYRIKEVLHKCSELDEKYAVQALK